MSQLERIEREAYFADLIDRFERGFERALLQEGGAISEQEFVKLCLKAEIQTSRIHQVLNRIRMLDGNLEPRTAAGSLD